MKSPLIQEDVKTIAENLRELAPRFAGKTLLISGGAGFLGKYFLSTFKYWNDNILDKPLRVISVDNYITGQKDAAFDYESENIMDVWGDVTHPLPVREDIDFIIHAAGLASPVFYQKYPLETIESAVTGAKNLLDLAQKNPKLAGFLFFSSSEIYGDPAPDAIPTPETYHGNVSSVGPRACYDESKRLSETVCMIYQQKYGVPAKIVRPFNVFGPGMRHDDRRVVPMFAYQALNGQTLTVHGDGHQTRTFCYITDAINGFLRVLLLGKPGEAYNIGNADNEISMRNFAALFSELVPGAKYQMVPYPDTYPAGEPQRRCPDLTKAREQLGYEAKVSMREGLKRFLDWAKTQEAYVSVPKPKNTRRVVKERQRVATAKKTA
ncbi:MAG: NAD-dependent epimerase/dehydratase family protein [Patescibacteria group bacterium]